jgi:catechol 2,3-dioxygenase-like lactoylglutathione lyase family enzyme
MLGSAPLVAFVPVTDIDRAKAFYVDKLDLAVESSNPFALVLKAGPIRVRVTPVGEFTPHPFTVLGWEVASIKAVARQLVAIGISFERFEGMEQDDLGIWTSPDGSEVMWFKDPDGNLLSIAEHHAVMPPSATRGSAADLPT